MFTTARASCSRSSYFDISYGLWSSLSVSLCLTLALSLCLSLSLSRSLSPSLSLSLSPLTEQNRKCIVRNQASDVVLRKYFCVKNFCCQVIDNHSRDFQASNSAKECQLNQAEPQEVKDNS